MVTYAALTVINLSPYDSLILQMLHDEIEYFEGLLNRRHRLAEHQSLWWQRMRKCSPEYCP